MATDVRKTMDKALADFNSKSDQAVNALKKSAELQIVDTVKKSSKLGARLNELAAGMQSLAITVTDSFPHIAESIPKNVKVSAHIGPVKLTANVPGLSSKLVPTISDTDKQKLIDVTGDTAAVAAALPHVIIAAPFPDAVAEAVKKAIPNVTKTELQVVAKDLVDLKEVVLPNAAIRVMLAPALSLIDPAKKIEEALNTVIADVAAPIGAAVGLVGGLSALKASVANVSLQLGQINITFGFDSLIENVVEQAFAPARGLLSQIAIKNGIAIEIPQADLKLIINAVSSNNFGKAKKLLAKFSDVSEDKIDDILKSIDNSATKAVRDNSPAPVISTKSKKAEDNINGWNSGNPKSDYWSGQLTTLQLKSELMAVERDITEVVVVAANTGTDVQVYAKDYYEDNPGGPYSVHYFIGKGGAVERILPVSVKADPTPALPNGHDDKSIIIMLEGGIKGAHPDETFDTPIEFGATYSRVQLGALRRLIGAIYSTMSGIQVLGGDDIGSSRPGPYIDMGKFIDAHFDKKNIRKNWLEEGPAEKTEINNEYAGDFDKPPTPTSPPDDGTRDNVSDDLDAFGGE